MYRNYSIYTHKRNSFRRTIWKVYSSLKYTQNVSVLCLLVFGLLFTKAILPPIRLINKTSHCSWPRKRFFLVNPPPLSPQRVIIPCLGGGDQQGCDPDGFAPEKLGLPTIWSVRGGLREQNPKGWSGLRNEKNALEYPNSKLQSMLVFWMVTPCGLVGRH